MLPRSHPDSAGVDDALIARLLGDSVLTGLMPDGVYFDESRPGAQRFVIVSLVDEVDIPVYVEGRAVEQAIYLVKAVALSTSGIQVREAAKRIDDLLEDQQWTAPGFSCISAARQARVRITEVDDDDRSIRWHHRGGRYQVRATLDHSDMLRDHGRFHGVSTGAVP